VQGDPYPALAAALRRLPNGFPSTTSGIELQVLRAIYAPDEARLAAALTEHWEWPEQIAERTGLDPGVARARLRALRKRGLVWGDLRGGRPAFRLAPFVVGSYEAQVETIGHHLAHLIEELMLESGGLEAIMRPRPALHRVVPARGAVKREWILPYDDVKRLLLQARSYRAAECICRKQQDLVGKRKCSFPLRVCLRFSKASGPPGPEVLSQDQALALLDECEEAGLVHTVSNVARGVNYVCNCCGCCCGILRGIVEFGIADSVAYANYYARIHPERCTDCGACRSRCQVGALTAGDGPVTVDRERCIGCGLCVTGCKAGALELVLRPEQELVVPPEDFGSWEAMRRDRRGV
jgi:NAD-dependent dihydropyrimidine dehydrogenase PreA subunit